MFPGKIPKKLVAPTQSMVAALKFFLFFLGGGILVDERSGAFI